MIPRPRFVRLVVTLIWAIVLLFPWTPVAVFVALAMGWWP